MAVFYSNTSWDYRAVDFNQVIRGLTDDIHFGGSTIRGFHIGSSLSVTEGFSVVLPTFPFQNALLLNWTGGQTQIGGNGFAYGADGALTAGTVKFVFGVDGSVTLYGLADIALRATNLWSALHTAGTTDDKTLMASLFSGDDAVALSGHDDVFASGNGIDLVSGLSGNDRLLAGPGNDYIDGGTGADTLLGEAGDDILAGGADRDKLFGDVGADILFGGKGNDVLTGGGNADLFIAEYLGGKDVITDFGTDADRIVLQTGTASRFSDLVISQDGDDAIISYTKGSLRLVGTDAGTLTRNMFLFDLDAAVSPQFEQFSLQWDYWHLMA